MNTPKQSFTTGYTPMFATVFPQQTAGPDSLEVGAVMPAHQRTVMPAEISTIVVKNQKNSITGS